MPFSIICKCNLGSPHIKFLRIKPNNLQLTIRQIFNSLIDMSWIDSFMPEVLRISLRARVEPTVERIKNNFNNGAITAVDRNSGELVVSELARISIVNQYGYLDIPLGELISTQASQNPGFDFYSANSDNILLFGESKYIADRTANIQALRQIVDFQGDKKDDKDLITVYNHIPNDIRDDALEKYNNGKKGYIAAFASKNESDEDLISKIQDNDHFKQLITYSELICVAIDV